MLQRFTERNPWIVPVYSLSMGPEQHVADSSNYSLYLVNTGSFDPVAQHSLGTRGSRHTAENHAIQQKSEPKTADFCKIDRRRETNRAMCRLRLH